MNRLVKNSLITAAIAAVAYPTTINYLNKVEAEAIAQEEATAFENHFMERMQSIDCDGDGNNRLDQYGFFNGFVWDNDLVYVGDAPRPNSPINIEKFRFGGFKSTTPQPTGKELDEILSTYDHCASLEQRSSYNTRIESPYELTITPIEDITKKNVQYKIIFDEQGPKVSVYWEQKE